MYLDVVRPITARSNDVLQPPVDPAEGSVFEAWRDWSPSRIRHHRRMCCEIAREWLTATDFSTLNGGHVMSGPRWLRNRFPWGPSSYPLYWCEAVRKTSLDCGALAALAQEVFIMRGVRSFRAQMVQRYSRIATEQWSDSWRGDGVPRLWLGDDMIYHEGCAVVVGTNEIKVWDASAGTWVDPKARDGYGALLAIKVTCPPRIRSWSWGEYVIRPNEWREID